MVRRLVARSPAVRACGGISSGPMSGRKLGPGDPHICPCAGRHRHQQVGVVLVPVFPGRHHSPAAKQGCIPCPRRVVRLVSSAWLRRFCPTQAWRSSGLSPVRLRTNREFAPVTLSGVATKHSPDRLVCGRVDGRARTGDMKISLPTELHPQERWGLTGSGALRPPVRIACAPWQLFSWGALFLVPARENGRGASIWCFRALIRLAHQVLSGLSHDSPGVPPRSGPAAIRSLRQALPGTR